MYEIKVLNSKEFDRLPYDGISDSLGIADVRKNQVFVRDTGVHELNRYLISHEIDHLVEEHATDEDENGIRHKKGPKIFKDIILPLFTGFNGRTGEFNPLGILGGFGGSKQPEQPQQQQSSGSYDPLQGLMDASGGFGGHTPLSLFGSSSGSYPASGRLPDSVSGSIEPSITLGGNNSQLPPDLLQRLAGTYSGRLVF